MALTATPVFIQTPNLAVNTITTTTGTASVTVMTAGVNGSKVVALTAQNNTTVASIITLSVSTGGGTAKRLGASSVALSTDNTGAATDLLSGTIVPGLPVDNDGQKYLFLPSTSYSLQVAASATLSTVTASKSVDFTAVYGDF
jgi:hypothetical protein